MRAVDGGKKMFEEVQLAVERLVAQQTGPHLGDAYGVVARRDSLAKVLDDTRLDLHAKLGMIEFLADQSAQNGDTNTAERAYLRALQGYCSPPFNTSTAHWKLLLKVANFYSEDRRAHV